MPTPLLTNRQIGPDLPRQNLLTNGGMDTWQRGNGPFTATGGGTVCADRWYIQLRGTATGTCQRETTDYDGVGPAGAASSMSVNCTATSSTTNDTTNSLTVMTMNINEAVSIGAIGGVSLLINQPCSYTIRAKATTAGAVITPYVYVGTSNTFVQGAAVTLTTANTWYTISLTATQPTGGAWYFGVFFHSVATYRLDNAMMVAGTQPVAYVPVHPGDDFQRCLRYYQRWQSGAANQDIAAGQAYGAGTYIVMVPYQAPLGGATPSPVLTYSALADWGVSDAGFTQYIACTSISVRSWNLGRGMFNLQGAVASGLTAGQATTMGSRNTNAWLAVEWNP